MEDGAVGRPHLHVGVGPELAVIIDGALLFSGWPPLRVIVVAEEVAVSFAAVRLRLREMGAMRPRSFAAAAVTLCFFQKGTSLPQPPLHCMCGLAESPELRDLFPVHHATQFRASSTQGQGYKELISGQELMDRRHGGRGRRELILQG